MDEVREEKDRYEKYGYNYSTSDEVGFLAGIGTYNSEAPESVSDVLVEERLRLLKNYRASMKNRANWGRIDPAKIDLVVSQMIAEVEAMPA